MLRKIALALLLSTLISHVAVAGALRSTLTSIDPTSSAHGTFQAANGKPSDALCRIRVSVKGLKPIVAPYYIQAHLPDGTLWSLGFFTAADGSGTASGTTISQVMSATQVELVDGMTGQEVMQGK